MKSIVLVCSAGMSTSLLVTKMQKAATEQDIQIHISAVSEADLKYHSEEIDCLLLGPQVRFLLSKMSGVLEAKGIPVAVINSVDYGMMNGQAVLEQALKLMASK